MEEYGYSEELPVFIELSQDSKQVEMVALPEWPS